MKQNTKKFAEHLNEVKKMSFMDLINMSDDIPKDSSDTDTDKDLDLPRRKPAVKVEEPLKKPLVLVDDEDDEDEIKPKKGKEITPFTGELQIGKTVKELLGPKLFVDYVSLKKIQPELGVEEFLRSEIKDLEKHMLRLKGSDLSGAKTKLKLMKLKLEDAELVKIDDPTLSMSTFISGIDKAGISIQNVIKNEEKISLKFEIDEKYLTKLTKLIQSFGGKSTPYGFTPPYDPWFMEGCEWRIYPTIAGKSKVYCAFSEI